MDGVPIPFLPYSLVNQEKLIVLLDKIQTAIPEEIQQADQILHQKEEIQLETQRRIQMMMQEAKQQADVMLSESELLKAVQLEADRVRQQVMAELQTIRQQALEEVETVRHRAYEEARQVREGADEYAEMVLKTLGKSLDEFQSVAKNAHKHLKKSRAEAVAHVSGNVAQSSHRGTKDPVGRPQASGWFQPSPVEKQQEVPV